MEGRACESKKSKTLTASPQPPPARTGYEPLAPGKGGMYGTTSDSEPAAEAPEPAESPPVATQPVNAKQAAAQKIKRCFVIAGGV